MKIHAPLFAACLAASLLADASPAQSPAAPRTWSRTYGGAVSEQGLHDIAQLPGGRLVVAGYSASFGGPTQANWFLNLQLGNGDVQLEGASTSSFGGFTDGACIAADGGALFLGRDVLDIFHEHDAWAMRLDADGDVAWTLGFWRPGAGRHFLFDAAELDDRSWVAAGATGILDQPPQAGWIVRIAADGSLLWQFEYGGGSVEAAHAVTTTADGGFVVAGASSSSGAGSDDVWVMKVDGAGAIVWQRTFGGGDADAAEDIVELADGGFAVVGSTNSLTPSGHAPWILRLDAGGNPLWHRVVASDVWGDLGAVAQTGDGHLVVVGRVAEVGFASNDLWCAKLAATLGRVLWQRAYEGDTGDFGSAVLPLADDGFIVGGTWGWGFEGESIWLQSTDRVGNLPDCDLDRTTTFALTRPPITVQDGSAVKAPGGALTQLVPVQTAASDAEVIERCH